MPRQVGDLVRDLRRAQADLTPKKGMKRTQGRAMFLVGAGCSASAGIPLASEVSREAVRHLASRYGLVDHGAPLPADQQGAIAALGLLVANGAFPKRFEPKDEVADWGGMYGYIFSDHIKHPNEQRSFISALVEPKSGEKEDPSFLLNWSHACLGELVRLRFVHTVLTTNFDQLVLKGIIRTGIIPVVADGLESLSRISPTPTWPQVVHVHGSMHTYELRNSYASLRETEHDSGLQATLLSVLKETDVLVIVGYSGGDEGIMALLQKVGRALPKMVVYWVAYESEYESLTPRARDLLETGEYKYFLLGQESDDFFNHLLGELGVGPPGWIKQPLEVLRTQIRIKVSDETASDVSRLINSYHDRVEHAVKEGTLPETPLSRATEARSALRFKEAADIISGVDDFQDDPDLLRVHATSLYEHNNRMDEQDADLLRTAIVELERLEASGGATAGDYETLIEARRDLYDVGEDEAAREALSTRIDQDANKALKLPGNSRQSERSRALMRFYKGEASQTKAERMKSLDLSSHPDRDDERRRLLGVARDLYAQALPTLAWSDAIRARECREGMAGALTELAELEATPAIRLSHAREARALFVDVVRSTARNAPGKRHAGALENLAGVVELLGRLSPSESARLRTEEVELLESALAAYLEFDVNDDAARVQARLETIRL